MAKIILTVVYMSVPNAQAAISGQSLVDQFVVRDEMGQVHLKSDVHKTIVIAKVYFGNFIQIASFLAAAAVVVAGSAGAAHISFFLAPALIAGSLGRAIAVDSEVELSRMSHTPQRRMSGTRSHPSSPKFFSKSAVENRPVGLYNASSNCWANALAQMIANSPALLKEAREINLPRLNDFLNTYSEAQGMGGEPLGKECSQKLREMFAQLSSGNISTDAKREEDVEEAFRVLMGERFKEQGAGLDAYQATGSRDLIEEEKLGSSFLLFKITHQWEKQKTTNCDDGGEINDDNQSFNHDYSSVLQFDLPNDRVKGIKDVVKDSLLDQSRLSGVRKKHSDNGECGVYDRTSSSIQILKAPQNLNVHYKRFKDPQTKNNVKIELESGLTMKIPKEHIENGDKDVTYDLVSFAVHLSSSIIGNGHYVAYTRKDGCWYCCNDSSVYPVKYSEVEKKSKMAYLLHFEKSMVDDLVNQVSDSPDLQVERNRARSV